MMTLGNTRVIATIKAEVDAPDLNSPNEGKIDFFIEWYVKLIHVELFSTGLFIVDISFKARPMLLRSFKAEMARVSRFKSSTK